MEGCLSLFRERLGGFRVMGTLEDKRGVALGREGEASREEGLKKAEWGLDGLRLHPLEGGVSEVLGLCVG